MKPRHLMGLDEFWNRLIELGIALEVNSIGLLREKETGRCPICALAARAGIYLPNGRVSEAARILGIGPWETIKHIADCPSATHYRQEVLARFGLL